MIHGHIRPGSGAPPVSCREIGAESGPEITTRDGTPVGVPELSAHRGPGRSTRAGGGPAAVRVTRPKCPSQGPPGGRPRSGGSVRHHRCTTPRTSSKRLSSSRACPGAFVNCQPAELPPSVAWARSSLACRLNAGRDSRAPPPHAEAAPRDRRPAASVARQKACTKVERSHDRCSDVVEVAPGHRPDQAGRIRHRTVVVHGPEHHRLWLEPLWKPAEPGTGGEPVERAAR